MQNPTTRISMLQRLNDRTDQRAWDQFINRYRPVIFRVAQRMGLSFADADEATQEVLVQLLRVVSQWSAERPNATFRGWLYRVARHVIIKYRRTQEQYRATDVNEWGQEQMEQTVSSANPGQEFDREFRQQTFLAIAGRIRPLFSESNWQAFWKTYVESEDIAVVARVLQLRVSDVYVARSRILRRFREEAEKFLEGKR